MREIKFRAWYNESEEWMYAGLKNGIRSFPLTVSSPLSLCLDDRFGDKYENTVWCLNDDELIWCQFTGLLDKNGVEIYEGDVVRTLNGNYKLGKVVFEFGMFCFSSVGNGIYANSDIFEHIHSLHYREYDTFNNYEVIGNIYEHTHLLEANHDR